MQTQPEPDPHADARAVAQRHNARVGLFLFAVYLLAYGGFVYLAAFSPAAMAQTPLWGLNLAVLYGMGLIAGALVVALVYLLLCKQEPAR